jgi:hypothetical protein
MRDIKATVRLQPGIEGVQAVRSQERGVAYDRYRWLRIDLPEMESSRHNGAKRAHDS